MAISIRTPIARRIGQSPLRLLYAVSEYHY
jgi:hypothetical protein